jgi:hypothetical protein
MRTQLRALILGLLPLVSLPFPLLLLVAVQVRLPALLFSSPLAVVGLATKTTSRLHRVVPTPLLLVQADPVGLRLLMALLVAL